MSADKRLDALLDMVEAPPPSDDLLARLRILPLRRARGRWDFAVRAWRFARPLPAVLTAAAAAGFAVGLLTAAAPRLDPAPAVDLATLAGYTADVIVVELMEDVLWPYDSPVILVSY